MVLLATSALASVTLTTAARSADADWLPGAAGGDFNNASNWSGGAAPSGIANFNSGTTGPVDPTNIGFSQATHIGGFSVKAGNYVFDNGKLAVIFDGAGISLADGAFATFNNTFLLSFNGASTAGGTTIINQKDSILSFDGTANAGSAAITNFDKARLLFDGGSSAAQSLITNFAGGEVSFAGGSTAGRASIANSGSVSFGGTSNAGQAQIENNRDVVFAGSSSADHATITNRAGAMLDFNTDSTASNATITSEGLIFFDDRARGETARVIMKGAGNSSLLDITGLTTDRMMIGSVEGVGRIILGGKQLSVGGNNLSTTFDGVVEGGGGSLTKEGKGALTLTGVSTYTGQTMITGGALIVDGSIVSSSNVRVDAGGVLAGTGTVSSTNVFDGGTLVAGHGAAPFGALKVEGDLGFSKGATYAVQVSPSAAGKTNVTGQATLGGATVAASFAKGGYVTKQYNILHADSGLNGSTFGGLVNTNLAPFFMATLGYGANDVFLNLTVVDPDTIPGLNVNQRNVARGITNSFTQTGGLFSGAFATLATPASLTQVSGETAVGTQQATFDAMGQFMGVMLDPTMAGRGGGSPRNAMASMPRKAPVVEDFSSRWAIWAAGFGGSQSVNGDAGLGSNKTTSSLYGSAVGADYRLSPNTVVGFAIAGGATNFRVANGGSGNSDLFQVGTYLRHTQGAAYLAAALAYGWQDVTTNRTVTAAGFDSLRGSFNANALSGRLEGGYKVSGVMMDVTPYAAAQFVSYRLPSYVEQVVSGANTFALAYNGKDFTASRTELGFRTEKSFVQESDSVLTLRGRLAWAHDFNTDRNVQAAFVTLPGSAFTVNGAQASADAALTSLSAEMAWRSGWAASATFDGQFSDTTKSYAGKGVVRYAW
jgi:autotransporter-associated beta strand protein